MSRSRNRPPTAPTATVRRVPWVWVIATGVLLAAVMCVVLIGGRTESDEFGPSPAPGPAPEGMVWVPGGTFWMGTDEDGPHFADAHPVHKVSVSGFWMDKTEVTNAAFARFVAETGYVTVAERKPTKESIERGLPPGAPPPTDEQLVPGALVFV